MSKNANALQAHNLADMLRIVEDHPEWQQLRRWLAEHAPYSSAHRAIEHFAACCASTAHMFSVLTDAACGPRPGACSLLDIIERGISGDDVPEDAIADVLQWRLPKPFDVIDEYDGVVDIPPRCTAIQGHNRCVNIRHDESVAHDFSVEDPLMLMRVRRAQEGPAGK